MAHNWDYEARECTVCHRVGYRVFVISGSEGWRCLHETACQRRAAHREEVPQQGAQSAS